MTDKEIVDLYWVRSEDAIPRTKEQYGPYLSKISYNILADLRDCEECENDTYLAAWNSMPLNRPARLGTYLGRIIRQISIDIYRKRHARKRYVSEYALSLEELGNEFPEGGALGPIGAGAAYAGNPEREFDAKELDRAVNDFLRGLPEEERRLFIGRYYYFDSLKAAAAYLKMGEPKAKSMLHRTRRALREHLIKEGFIDE